MKTTVIHHSADFDGIFCREIARKFLPDAELIGWDFGDAPLDPVTLGQIYVLDLPVDRVFGFKYEAQDVDLKAPSHPAGLVWIDHHKSSIETHPKEIPGYRIDGVAACRLAWQWFSMLAISPIALTAPVQYPNKKDFVDRKVSEPLAVRLAGEYDVWDKRDPNAAMFQHGLRSRPLESCWPVLLGDDLEYGESEVGALLLSGLAVEYSKTQENESVSTKQGFTLNWEGFCFIACNAARYNSQLFAAAVKPEHDACLGFNWDGQLKKWRVSLYGVPGKPDVDLTPIAKKYGGGGHKQACGFQCDTLPFDLTT